MKANEFRQALIELGMTQRKFAAEIEADVTTINRWALDKQPIPGVVRAYLALRLKIAELKVQAK